MDEVVKLRFNAFFTHNIALSTYFKIIQFNGIYEKCCLN